MAELPEKVERLDVGQFSRDADTPVLILMRDILNALQDKTMHQLGGSIKQSPIGASILYTRQGEFDPEFVNDFVFFTFQYEHEDDLLSHVWYALVKDGMVIDRQRIMVEDYVPMTKEFNERTQAIFDRILRAINAA